MNENTLSQLVTSCAFCRKSLAHIAITVNKIEEMGNCPWRTRMLRSIDSASRWKHSRWHKEHGNKVIGLMLNKSGDSNLCAHASIRHFSISSSSDALHIPHNSWSKRRHLFRGWNRSTTISRNKNSYRSCAMHLLLQFFARLRLIGNQLARERNCRAVWTTTNRYAPIYIIKRKWDCVRFDFNFLTSHGLAKIEVEANAETTKQVGLRTIRNKLSWNVNHVKSSLKMKSKSFSMAKKYSQSFLVEKSERNEENCKMNLLPNNGSDDRSYCPIIIYFMWSCRFNRTLWVCNVRQWIRRKHAPMEDKTLHNVNNLMRIVWSDVFSWWSK